MSIQMGDGIRLLSGAMMDYAAPELSDATIDDIATALSKVCRFAGHIEAEFYSVAQHAVNCSRIVPPEHAFSALMHDTAEAFTNDLPTPLKFKAPFFKDLEIEIESAMADRFGFQYPLSSEVKLADLQMLRIEKEEIKRDFSSWAITDDVEVESVRPLVDLSLMYPNQARDLFLARYAELAA